GREIIISSNRPGGQGGIDQWVSTRATTLDPWGTPVNLGPVVNTAFNDGAAALSSDGQTMYFYSDRPGGSGGNDLYVTTREKVHGNCGAPPTAPGGGADPGLLAALGSAPSHRKSTTGWLADDDGSIDLG